MFELQEITLNDYAKEKKNIFKLVDKIWTRKESAMQAKHSINRWGSSKNETGNYFYILQNAKIIGLTGYFIAEPKRGVFGLRHHGTMIKGTGRQALNLLVDHLKSEYKNDFKYLAELIPQGKENLIPVFEKWGFVLEPNGVPEWEPKRDYYKYYLVRKETEPSEI